ncbi:MAG: DUF1851 domain-containing protein [Actinomycetota bacterium]|nr:DUF1851 domain-containing protein [Actinomycetota bacterium]
MLGDGIATIYGLDRAPVPAAGGFGDRQLDRLFAELSGASFGGGLYRVHTPELARLWTHKAEQCFPEYRGRVVCFGYDWLGRQFALDREPRDGARHVVLLLEPGTGDVLEIPATVASLHTEELVQYGDAALALSFYADWREATRDEEYLQQDECVGYDVPLFLGGEDEVANLSRIDMDVYWTITAQLRHGTLRLPPGTTVRDVSRDG